MKSKSVFPGEVNVTELIEFFIQCQALECDTNTLSIIAGTLANGGICPITCERVLKAETVKNCLSIMNCCGMSDYSGEFAYNIGLPSKSGIQGATMIVIPGKMGVCVYSPLLDNLQNSSRGV
jgi:glutaminase